MSSTNIVNSYQPGMSLRNWMLLLCLSILWGGSFFLNAVIIKHVPVLSIVFFRVFFAAILLLLFMKITKTTININRSIIGSFLIMGLINNFIPFTLIVGGQAHIGSGLAAVLNATTPLFAAVVAHISTDDAAERLGPKRIIGILFGIAGVTVLLAPKLGAVGFSGSEVFGQIAILGAALSYGLAVVYGRRFGKQGISPVVAATGQVSASSFLLLPLVLIIDKPWTYLGSIDLNTFTSMLSLSIFCTAFAYILYFKLIKEAGATNASLVTLLVPVSAIILGVLFLGETFTVNTAAGMAFIGLGLLVIDGRIFSYWRKSTLKAADNGSD